MKLRDKLEHTFKRTIIERQYTALFRDLDKNISDMLLVQIDDRSQGSNLIAANFLSIDHWLIVSDSGVFWRNSKDVNYLSINEIESAYIDLDINNSFGFDSNVGFNILSLKTNNREILHIKIEGRSALQAIVNVLNEFVKSKKNSEGSRGQSEVPQLNGQIN